jgi:hypothetical protein
MNFTLNTLSTSHKIMTIMIKTKITGQPFLYNLFHAQLFMVERYGKKPPLSYPQANTLPSFEEKEGKFEEDLSVLNQRTGHTPTSLLEERV